MTTLSTATSSLATAVSSAVKTDVTRALGAAGYGSLATTQPMTDAIVKISQDAVSALQSSGSQSAAAALSKVITSDVNSVLNQFGASASVGSSQIAAFTKALSDDVLSAAQAAGYGAPEAVASAPAAVQTAAPAVAAPAPAAVPSPAPAATAPVAAPTAAGNAPATASTATASTAPAASGSSAIDADDTIASIMKALSPLMGNGTQFSSVVNKIADSLGKPRVGGGAGTILSSVADKLRQADTAAAAAAKAASGAPPAAAPAGPAPASPAAPAGPAPAPASTSAGVGSSSAAAALALLTGAKTAQSAKPAAAAAQAASAQSAVNTIAGILAQGQSAVGSVTGKALAFV